MGTILPGRACKFPTPCHQARCFLCFCGGAITLRASEYNQEVHLAKQSRKKKPTAAARKSKAPKKAARKPMKKVSARKAIKKAVKKIARKGTVKAAVARARGAMASSKKSVKKAVKK